MEDGDQADRETIEINPDSQNDDSQNGDAQVELFTSPQAVERRIWRSILVLVAVAIVFSLAFADRKVTLGLALGGLLALLNFKWLHISVQDILGAGTSKAPPGTLMMFVVRWLVVAIVIYGASVTGYFDTVAMLGGLFAPALAVMLEAGYVTYKTIAQSKERD